MKHLDNSKPRHGRASGGRHLAPSNSGRHSVPLVNAEKPVKHTEPPVRGEERRKSKAAAKKCAVRWCIFGALVLAAAAIVFLLIQRSNQMAYERLSEQAHSLSQPYIPPATATPAPTQSPSAEPTQTPEPTATPEPGPAAIPVDFDYLCGINDDIIGWIQVEGTDIDYPILYDSVSRPIYIDHDYWLAYSVSGSIFVQDYNSDDFSSFNTVIYGHNMNDGSMFAPLHKFREEEFFEQNDTITIYAPDRRLTYRIFAVYRTDDRNINVVFSDDSEQDRQEYLDHVYSHETLAFYDEEVTVTPEDKIITLSTCIDHMADYRYLVQAVLVADEEGVYAPD